MAEALNEEAVLDAVAAAIEAALDRLHRDFGLFDYSHYGQSGPAHVVRDYRIRDRSQAIFASDDREAAAAFWKRHCDRHVARAAIEAYLAHAPTATKEG